MSHISRPESHLWVAITVLCLVISMPHKTVAQQSCEAPPLPEGPRISLHNGKPLLRIAADPNNLPFSNERREGLENKLAEIVAREMGAEIEYVWRAQRRGFFRH